MHAYRSSCPAPAASKSRRRLRECHADVAASGAIVLISSRDATIGSMPEAAITGFISAALGAGLFDFAYLSVAGASALPRLPRH